MRKSIGIDGFRRDESESPTGNGTNGREGCDANYVGRFVPTTAAARTPTSAAMTEETWG